MTHEAPPRSKETPNRFKTQKAAEEFAQGAFRQTGREQAIYVFRFEGENEFDGKEIVFREYIVRPVGEPLSDRDKTFGFERVTTVDAVQEALL